MAKTLTATVTGSIQYTYTKTRTIANTVESKTVTQATNYTSGAAANQAEIIYSEQVTVTAASPNQDFDLYESLTDVFGDTLSFEHVRAMEVRNLSTTSGDDIYFGPLGLDNGFSSPWGGDASAKNSIRAGGALLIDAPRDGFAIETTSQNLRAQYQGTSGSINVQVVFMGTTGDLVSSSSSSSSLAFSSSSSSSSSSVAVSSSSGSSSSSYSSSSSSSVAFSSSSSSSSVVFSSSSLQSVSSSSQSSGSSSSSSSGGSSYSSSSGGSSLSSSSSSSSSASSTSSQG